MPTTSKEPKRISKEPSYMTGAEISVGGGYTAVSNQSAAGFHVRIDTEEMFRQFFSSPKARKIIPAYSETHRRLSAQPPISASTPRQ